MKIYNIFYISFLIKVLLGSLLVLVVNIELLDLKQEFKVEVILDYRYFRGTKK